jgi:hypothetical protein
LQYSDLSLENRQRFLSYNYPRVMQHCAKPAQNLLAL